MIKKLLALSTVIGAAALLQNKARRDRLTQQAQSFLKGAREKLDMAKNKNTHDERDSMSAGYSAPSGAGATSRTGTTGHVTTPRNGIY